MKTFLLITLILLQNLIFNPSLAYEDITPEEVHNRLAAGDTLLLLDVREIFEYTAGHIAEPSGLLPITPANMPWSSGVLSNEYDRLPTEIDIIVYCQSGGRSALASAFLETQGFTRIYNMLGGFLSWIYEYREDGYGDHSGKWVSSSGPDPVIINCTESMDTSKIIFPVNALPGIDSIYIELHFASPYPHDPPNVPQSDMDGLFRVTALDPFGLTLFIDDSLTLSDTAEIILVPEFHGNIIFYPELKIFIPGEEWHIVASQFNIPAFYRNEIILRKWYNGEGHFTTDVIVFNNQPETFEVHVYPNPFNGSLQIVAPPDGSIKVYDIRGRLVESLESNTWNPDAHVGSGTYFITVQYEDLNIARKVVYLK